MGVFKNKVNILIVLFFVMSLVYVIYSIFIDDENKEKNNSINTYTNEEIAIYSTKEYILSDYNTFYNVEQIIQQIISALSEENYKKIYKAFSSDFAGDISKEQYQGILKEFYISNFSSEKDQNGNIIDEYVNEKNLVNVYQIKENTYIAEIKNNHDTTTKIGIKITSSNTYEIVYIGF